LVYDPHGQGATLELHGIGASLELHGIGASRHPAVQSEKTLQFNPKKACGSTRLY